MSGIETDESATGLTPVLIGCGGWVDGERYVLKSGEAVVIGRSRDCDISLRRIGAYIERSQADRDADYDFNTVSRRHLRLRVDGTMVELEDLSSNGSYCDHQAIEQSVRVDLGEREVTIRLGTRETFRLQLLPLPAQPSAGSDDPPVAKPVDDAD